MILQVVLVRSNPDSSTKGSRPESDPYKLYRTLNPNHYSTSIRTVTLVALF